MRSECSEILLELESWYRRGNGAYLQQAVAAHTRELLDTTFGYHSLQLGVHTDPLLTEASPIHHRLYCSPAVGNSQPHLLADAEELPLESDSIDAVVAFHCLEFSAHPHQVLREIHRVLTAQGQLLVVGFNPYSLHGIGARLRGLLGNSMWSAYRPVGEARLMDWLSLLGCDVNGVRRLYGVPPAGGERLRRWLARCDDWTVRHNLPCGGVYVVQATKQVIGFNRKRGLLRVPRRRLIGLVGKPSPAPTPSVPLPQRYSSFEKGDAAA